MSKLAIVVLADTETHGDLGRIANAIEVAKELKESNDEVKIIFDGAGVKWVPKLSDKSNKLYEGFEKLRDNIAGVCSFCSNAFGVKNAVQSTGVKLLDEFEGHPSLKHYIDNGYQVITF
ncbi:DsrE family protein [Melioribacteraceae bacterium 4301-Me]|uniref:DsrE family protein n=1 Tax=Pyranulibacter aquaticus TaxID=3163344 RepID=UPI003595CC0C